MRRFRKLRAALMEAGIDQRYLAELLGRGPAYVSNCMTGKRFWRLNEQYKIMDILGLPYEDLHLYFPPNGVTKGERSVIA